MKPTRSLLGAALLAVLATLAVAVAPAQADDDENVRSEAGAYPARDARLVSVEVPIGELRVIAATGDQIEARLRVTCERSSRRCREKAAEVHLRPRRTGSTIELEVVGLEGNNRHGSSPTPHVDLQLPVGLSLRAEVGVGEVDIRGVTGDVEVETGVGEVRVAMAEAAVREVRLDVGVGEAHLSPRPEGSRSSRFLFLGNEVDWRDGTGRASVQIEVGVGEAHVDLLP